MNNLKLLPLLLLTLSSCEGTRLSLMKRGLGSSAGEYFGDHAVRFDTVAERVYSFRDGFDRDLVIDTDAGLVVVNPYNAEMTGKLAAILKERFPGKPVSHLLYSHYHLDHTGGGAALAPREVIAHKRCPQYWAEVDGKAILPPTKLIEGDVNLEIGGVQIRLLDLGKSHTDTMYAVYLPQKKVLFAADMILVKSLAPVGHPDIYRPGFLHALDRLAALDFETYVPSHFDAGTKADFLAGKELYDETNRLVRAAVAAEGRRLIDDEQRFTAAFNGVFDTLHEKYGAWHGGGAMLLLFVQRNFTGEFLGY